MKNKSLKIFLVILISDLLIAGIDSSLFLLFNNLTYKNPWDTLWVSYVIKTLITIFLERIVIVEYLKGSLNLKESIIGGLFFLALSYSLYYGPYSGASHFLYYAFDCIAIVMYIMANIFLFVKRPVKEDNKDNVDDMQKLITNDQDEVDDKKGDATKVIIILSSIIAVIFWITCWLYGMFLIGLAIAIVWFLGANFGAEFISKLFKEHCKYFIVTLFYLVMLLIWFYCLYYLLVSVAACYYNNMWQERWQAGIFLIFILLILISTGIFYYIKYNPLLQNVGKIKLVKEEPHDFCQMLEEAKKQLADGTINDEEFTNILNELVDEVNTIENGLRQKRNTIEARYEKGVLLKEDYEKEIEDLKETSNKIKEFRRIKNNSFDDSSDEIEEL